MNFDFSKQKHKKLAIIEKAQTNVVCCDEITHLDCNGDLVFVFHVNKNSPYSYTRSLKEIECELAGFGFLRINRNRVVNMQHVVNLNAKRRELRLANEVTLLVSRRKWQIIRDFFGS